MERIDNEDIIGKFCPNDNLRRQTQRYTDIYKYHRNWMLISKPLLTGYEIHLMEI